jgi:predicted RNA-binding protein YlqC (UPF0109 family)
MQIKELVENIVRALVDFPEQVRVREIEATNVRVLEIKVAKQDVRYLLGKKGKNIQALRTIISAVSKKERCMVQVLEPNKPEQWLDNGNQ